MPNRCMSPNDTNQYRLWARRILCCYPRAWRERYEREMEQVLLSHTVTFWTLLDLLVGALDARLHPDLLPRRITTMVYRLRTSEIVVFCAFVAYSVAWFAVRFVRDPIPVWEHVVQVHPEIRTALVAVDSAGVMALLALLIGGVPMVYVVLRNAFRDRQWLLLGLLAVPPLAFTILFSLFSMNRSFSSCPDISTKFPSRVVHTPTSNIDVEVLLPVEYSEYGRIH